MSRSGRVENGRAELRLVRGVTTRNEARIKVENKTKKTKVSFAKATNLVLSFHTPMIDQLSMLVQC